MRRFNSYGPVDTEEHFYAPRRNLIDWGYTQLIGDNPLKGGHYITVWAPRQTGKSWVMLQVMERIRKQETGNGNSNIDVDVDVIKVDLENRPGALAEVATELGNKGINIEYCYGALSKKGNATAVIMDVSDVDRALKLLK